MYNCVPRYCGSICGELLLVVCTATDGSLTCLDFVVSLSLTMSSPPPETILSASPTSIRGGSPVRRRDSVSPSDERPRLSPTLVRSYDLNDPEIRERQRTMDVDMAMHLSRARRDTVNVSPGSSPYEHPAPSEDTFHPISALSPHEEEEMHIARGDAAMVSTADITDRDSVTTKRQPSFVDLRGHIHTGQDPALLVSLGDTREHPSASVFALPSYQANASRSQFDFSVMEDFAEVEKTNLGISSPTTKFAIPPPRASASKAAPEEPSDGPSAFTIPTPRSRQRKLSQSNSNPRMRKGAGKKLALFEGNAGILPSSSPGRMNILGGTGASSSDDLPALASTGPTFGVHNTGHDRPYRFSFYSNALSATIHARSLSELPAEGQTFRDLFTGLKSPQEPPSMFTNARIPQRSASHGYFPHEKGARGGNDDSEGSTWWLDVQSPTDEEMKILSKVCYFIYGRHGF